MMSQVLIDVFLKSIISKGRRYPHVLLRRNCYSGWPSMARCYRGRSGLYPSVTADSDANQDESNNSLYGSRFSSSANASRQRLKAPNTLFGPFAERVQDAHEDFTGQSALLGLRTEADLARDDQWAQLAFGAVVLRRDGWAFGPVIESRGVFTEDVLDLLNARMLRRRMDRGLDLQL